MLGYSAEEMVGRETPTVFHLASELQTRYTELGADRGTHIKDFADYLAPVHDR